MQERTKKNSREKRTLLFSVLISIPAPVFVGLGLFLSKSSTQVCDFVRRTSEFAAILVAYFSYCAATKNGLVDEAKKIRIERRSNIVVGLLMILAGGIMFVLSFASEKSAQGNVAPVLVVSLGAAAFNVYFWIKYTRLDKANPDEIIAVQARIYMAKSFVDICLSLTFLSFILFPGTSISEFFDTIGSAVVSAYLVWVGIRTILKTLKKTFIQKA